MNLNKRRYRGSIHRWSYVGGGSPAIFTMTSSVTSTSATGRQSDNNTLASTAGTLSMLAHVVSTTGPHPITDDSKYRVYGGGVQTRTTIGGQQSVTNSPVIYRIGRYKSKGSKVMNGLGSSGVPTAQRFLLNSAYATELVSLNRKYTNFTGDFRHADYSGMLERLGAALGVYATHGTLTWEELRNGAALNVRALGMYDDPVAATANTVFVPRTASLQDAKGTFCAIVGVANACGSCVATDVVHVDANTNAPQISVTDGEELAFGCLHATRILLSIMSKSDVGALGAYAFFKGLHQAVTVVGHTDEGGVMRDVLREGSFAPPHGGVYVGNYREFGGLPIPMAGSLASFECLVDGCALMSAAAVAIAAPVTTYKGRTFPFTSTVKGAVYGDGSHNEGDATDAAYHAKVLALECGEFAVSYAAELGRLLNVGDGGAADAAAHLQNAFGLLSRRVTASRHLAYKVVAPYYWVEPTTLYKSVPNTGAACAAGYGPLVGVGDTGAMNYFERHSVVRSGTDRSTVVAEYRSARTCGAIMHHQLNPNDGLAAFVPRQAMYDGFVMRGGPDEAIATTMQRSGSLADYVWRRGDAGVPAPAEAMYVGGTIGFSVKHGAFDDNLDFTPTCVKTGAELIACPEVHVTATAPVRVGLMGVGDRPRSVRRSRTLAAVGLTTARAMRFGGMVEDADVMPIGNCAPVMAMPATACVEAVKAVGAEYDAPETCRDQAGPPAARVTAMQPGRIAPPGAGRQIQARAEPAQTTPGAVAADAAAADDSGAPTTAADAATGAPPST